MIIPTWAVLGLLTAFISTFVPLIQEKYKVSPFVLVMWMKACVVVVGIPFVINFGLPTNPMFYLATFVSAILWAISDIAYFKTIPKVGAGVVTRVVPMTVIITFLVWILIDESVRSKYLADPIQASLIAGTIFLSAFFAFRLTKCPLSWQGIRMLWFVLFACAIGPILDTLSVKSDDIKLAPYAFMVIQGLLMMSFWAIYNLKTKVFEYKQMLEPTAIKAGLSIGVIAAFSMIMRTTGFAMAENPAYLTVMLFTDALWVLLIYKIIGRKEESDILSGIGIVFCAMGLILIKSL
jgi:hypothetical protein